MLFPSPRVSLVALLSIMTVCGCRTGDRSTLKDEEASNKEIDVSKFDSWKKDLDQMQINLDIDKRFVDQNGLDNLSKALNARRSEILTYLAKLKEVTPGVTVVHIGIYSETAQTELTFNGNSSRQRKLGEGVDLGELNVRLLKFMTKRAEKGGEDLFLHPTEEVGLEHFLVKISAKDFDKLLEKIEPMVQHTKFLYPENAPLFYFDNKKSKLVKGEQFDRFYIDVSKPGLSDIDFYLTVKSVDELKKNSKNYKTGM